MRRLLAVDRHPADRIPGTAPERQRHEPGRDEEKDDVQRRGVVPRDRTLGDRLDRRPVRRNEAERAEDSVDDQRGGDHRREHDRDDQRRHLAAVVLPVDQDDRDHDQVGVDECDHSGERDASRPQNRRERDVADRADERERGDDRPDEDVLQQLQGPALARDEEAVEEGDRQQRDVARDQEPCEDLLPQHLHVAAEVVRDRRPRLGGAELRSRLRRLVLVPGLRRVGVRARLLLEPPRYEEPDAEPHQRDQHDPADELGERELPPEEDPHDDADLEHEVRRRELEDHRRGEAGALLEERLGDRDRRIAARRRRRSQARGQRDLAPARSAQSALKPCSRHPRLDDSGEREAEHERPPHLPRHPERVLEAIDDEHVSRLASAATGTGPGCGQPFSSTSSARSSTSRPSSAACADPDSMPGSSGCSIPQHR